MKILIVGAGSTGGYFGARLIQAGRDVTFLVRPGRAAALRQRGLQIVSPYGDFTLQPPLVTAPELAGTYDVVLVTVKAFGLASAMDDFASAVGPQTMIMPVLNGMKHIDDLRERFGAERVVGGVCRVSTHLDDQGRVVQLTQNQQLMYGELDGGVTPRIQALDALLKDAGFDTVLSPRITQELWNKWIMLATLGGICVLARGSVGDIEATDGGGDLLRGFMGECASIAAAAGFAPSESVVQAATAMLGATGSPLTSSMYRDLVSGQAVEADQILGDLRARARLAGLSTPLISAAYVQLAIYQRQRRRAN